MREFEVSIRVVPEHFATIKMPAASQEEADRKAIDLFWSDAHTEGDDGERRRGQRTPCCSLADSPWIRAVALMVRPGSDASPAGSSVNDWGQRRAYVLPGVISDDRYAISDRPP
jgi:hypothetical protein